MGLAKLFAKLRFKPDGQAENGSWVAYSEDHPRELLTAQAATEAKAALIHDARAKAMAKAVEDGALWAQAWGESLAYKGRFPATKGRPKSALKMIAHFTAEGEELIIHALRVLRGEMTVTIVNNHGETITATPSIADQAEARRFLAERFWGRAPEKIEIGAPGSMRDDAPDLSAFTPEELRTQLALVRKLAPASEQTIEGETVKDK